MDIEVRFQSAVQSYLSTRAANKQKQLEKGKADAGTRGEVTGGAQMVAIELLVCEILLKAGLDAAHIKTKTALELPGFYRAEKKWDLLVVADGQLIAAMEFKSQVGSFGNNFNNRTEEAIGSATDIWLAYREGRLGKGPRPFLGYFFLLEDCPKVHNPVRNSTPYFDVDPVFKGASYSNRYEILCRRLMHEGLYSATCFTLSTNSTPTIVSQPAEDLSFKRFSAAIEGCAVTYLKGR